MINLSCERHFIPDCETGFDARGILAGASNDISNIMVAEELSGRADEETMGQWIVHVKRIASHWMAVQAGRVANKISNGLGRVSGG